MYSDTHSNDPYDSTQEAEYQEGLSEWPSAPVEQRDEFESAQAVTPHGAPAVPDASRQSPSDYYRSVLATLRDEAMRPDAKRGSYYLPHPVTGKTAKWQRVTNFVKLTDDTYHLELWKQRNIAKGVAVLALTRPGFIEDLSQRSVKADRDRLNEICTRAQDVADAYKMADEGTLLHSATEVADLMNGDLSKVLVEHRRKVRLYLDALAVHGLSVVDGMVERVTVSDRYGVAGKFDRIYRLRDGSAVIGDLKTGDSLDLSFPSIAAQLDSYRDGVNETGIFDGQRYDHGVKVRDDFGIVVHLPSTRDEVTVYAVDLSLGREINATNLAVRDTRKIKAKHVASEFQGANAVSPDEMDAYWLEQMNGVYTHDQLVEAAARARYFGQWNERLADQARIIAAELAQQIRR